MGCFGLKVTCDKWADGKMTEFDGNPEVASKKKKKYESRDGYKVFDHPSLLTLGLSLRR